MSGTVALLQLELGAAVELGVRVAVEVGKCQRYR